MKLYGTEHHMKSATFKNAMQKRHLKKYGVNNPLQREEIKKKVKQTCMQKYGVSNVYQRPDVVKRCMMRRIENSKRSSSNAEDKTHEILLREFKTVERQVTIFWKPTCFWAIDFCIQGVYVQFDGLYWHGIGKDIETLKTSNDKSAKMQLGAIRRDHYQNHWFKKNQMKLFRIVEGVDESIWLPELRRFMSDNSSSLRT